MSHAQITLDIRAIGRLWMPNCPAAIHRSYSIRAKSPDDIRTLEDAEHRLLTDSGDLSAIEDYQIAFTLTRTRKVPGTVGVVTHTRTWTARPWKGGEDSELTWADLTYPAEED